MPELRSCGVLVFRGAAADREFLLMKHPARWDLRKGHVDPGETDIECALRELEEENGMASTAIDLDPEFHFTQTYQVKTKCTGGEWRPKTLRIFLGRLTEDRPIVTTEHESYAWFPWRPPHAIQEQTIDPLLAAVAEYWGDV